MARGKTYRKIAGPRRRFVSSQSLYLGPDHLLSVENRGFEERYRRFPFDDIQAMGAARTPGGWVEAAVCGGLALVLASLALAAPPEFSPVFWIMAAPMAVAMLVLLVLGPTCSLYVQTSVQKTRLLAVKRFRKALKVMKTVRGRVEARQGRLDTAAMPPGAMEALPFTMGIRLPEDEAAPERHERARWHLALYYALLADSVATAADFALPQVEWIYLGVALLAAMAGLAITALIRQNGSDLPRSVKVLTAVVFGYMAALFFSAQALASVFMISQSEGILGQGELSLRLAALDPSEMGAIYYFYTGNMAGSLILGALGLNWVSRHRSAPHAA